MASNSSKGVALITGSAQGIGRGIAVRLAADGFDIALNDLPSNKEKLEECEQLVKKSGRRVITVYGDVSKEEDVKAFIQKTVDELGGLDVVIRHT